MSPKLPKFALLLFLCAVSAWWTPVSAKPAAPYALKTIKKGSNKGFDIVRLFNTQTQKVIWTRKLPWDAERTIAWSKDGKALAIYLRSPNKILIWRLGYKTRFFKSPDDYIMSFIWSPDNLRLLIRSGNSGMDSTPQCSLYCLNVGSKRMHYVGGTANESWLSNRKVQYSVLGYRNKTGEYYEIKKVVWYSP